MTERILVAMAILGLLLLVAFGIRRYFARKREQLIGERIEGGSPGILYFSGPGCSSCIAQRDILNELRLSGIVDVDIRQVDASVDVDLARRFGVIVVPTVVVSDGLGRVTSINSGLTDSDQIASQLLRAA